MPKTTAYEVEFRLTHFIVTEVPAETAKAPVGWETLRTISAVKSYLRSWRPHFGHNNRETARRFTEAVNLFTRADLDRVITF